MHALRQLIRLMIEADLDKDEELLTEPDKTNDENREDEASVVAGISGVTTPLGTDSTYPKKSKKKRKSAKEVSAPFGK